MICFFFPTSFFILLLTLSPQKYGKSFPDIIPAVYDKFMFMIRLVTNKHLTISLPYKQQGWNDGNLKSIDI